MTRRPQRSRGVRVLAAGIDSVYLSARGELRDDLLARLAQERAEAETSGEPIVTEPTSNEGAYLVRPHGWRGYRYWLTSANVELFVGAAAPFPPVYVMLHAAYLHTVGAEVALAEVEAMLSRDLFRGSCVLSVSRADLYADVQGWTPRPADADRFVCRAIRRRAYLAAAEAHRMRRELSGFTFGKGDLLARIYDKTRELAATGETWPAVLWDGADPERPVWRVEFQFRGRALRTFGITTPYGLLIGRQDLWDYATRWLSLRRRVPHARVRRWPESPTWAVIRGARMGSPASGLVRERVRQSDTVRLARGLVGYVSSLAVVTGTDDLDAAVAASLPIVRRYLADRGASFERIVATKRQRAKAS